MNERLRRSGRRPGTGRSGSARTAGRRPRRRAGSPCSRSAAARAAARRVRCTVRLLLGGGSALRPVRPRVSMLPAALPRCLERRLRLVWATARSLFGLRAFGGCGGGRRGPRARRPGARPDELGLARRARGGRRRRPRRRSRARVVLDVGRDLDEPVAASCRPSARTPGRPCSPPSRMSAAILLASSSVAGGASSTLKATSGGAGGDERRARRRMQVRRPVVGSEPGQRAGRAQARARAPARERAVEVDREPRSRPRRWASSSASATAAPRSASVRWTIGATSTTPTRGCTPAWAVRSMRSTASRAPSSSASCSAPGSAREREHAAVMVGVGVDVEQPRAAGDEGGADRVEASRRRGPRRRWGRRAAGLAHRGGRDDPPRRRRVVAERERPALGERRRAVLRALEDGDGVAVLEVAAAAELGPRR